MGFFERLTGKNKNMTESVRVTKNTDDSQALPYNQNDTYQSTDDILNMNEINKFRLLSNQRNEKYASFDLMAQDSRVASILNMYADDCTQYNQSSKVIWAESSDPDCADFMNRLLDNLQINKYAWTHIYSLCKYGDIYLELFYDLESKNEDNSEPSYYRGEGAKLLEQIEMIRNPSQIFDLIKQGKTEFYIKVHNEKDNFNTNDSNQVYNNYNQLESDLVLPADKFIHISINDAFTRFPNRYVLTNTETNKEETYDVKEGNSILANVFKTWSELSLLEDSVLLNRLSKSAIIRLIQIEVGNTDDDDVINILKALRDKISRSRYLDKGQGIYKNQVNPGPLENIVYHATHKGNGAITTSTIGGDVDVKALADIDHFLEKFAQGFPIPLAYVTQSNEGEGLSNGTSLTKFDARYGRTLKRIQNAYINGITDMLNVFAYKRGVMDYMNNFTIKMVSPSAVEDNERDEKLQNHTNMIKDIMSVINEVEDGYDNVTKKEILNYLIQTMLQDNGLNDILQEDMQQTLDDLETKSNTTDTSSEDPDEFNDTGLQDNNTDEELNI